MFQCGDEIVLFMNYLLLRSLAFTASLGMTDLLADLSTVAIVVVRVIIYNVNNRRRVLFFGSKRVLRYYSILLHGSKKLQGAACSWKGLFDFIHVKTRVPDAQVRLIVIVLRDIVPRCIFQLINNPLKMILQGMKCIVNERFRWSLIWFCKGFLWLFHFVNNGQRWFSKTKIGFFGG